MCEYVDDIKYVINYDYPNNSEDYVHRIGRTGRRDKTGTAYTFFTPQNAPKARDLIKVLEEAGQQVPQPLRDLQGRGGSGNSRGRWAGSGGGGMKRGYSGGDDYGGKKGSVKALFLIFASSLTKGLFLDVDDIKYVINYDYPNNSEDYVHRIGRTGRRDKTV
ncbi:helicase protein, partial [Cooperia oncophora]